MTKSYRFVVTGRVQGVHFRQSARAEGLRLGLAGWVRNRDDGAVEGCVGGADDALHRFAEWLRQGPPQARVSGRDWQPSEAHPAAGFVVLR